ncbi:MAG: response regulator [Pseudomonadota bacterium]|nr:hypothetical protein [Alphaproteobacteria bacterium]MEC7702262.1 response regulator [Pseudomonadota bacterium]MEC9234767.1 response regulator [Pseudomonadota bacterium]MEE3322536.1 response regulator [Pseudomonadota bacterium]|tara:strand:- start:4719 stop:5081 length:363 start_codon:yes stop_codon:yes gene_type:complete
MVKCLVVDDVELTRMTTEHVLEKMGMEAVLSVDLDDAKHALSRGGLIAVLLDCHIGKEDGFGLLEFIRNEYSSLPVIMFSGVDIASKKQKAMNLGATDFLEKPTTVEKIAQCFKKHGLLP